MTRPGWLIRGPRSSTVIITAPSVDADSAARRLDAVLAGADEESPAWYVAVQKTGYWWYLICVALVVPTFLVTGTADILQRVVSGLGGGVMLALVSGAVMNSVAGAQARKKRAAEVGSASDLKQQARVAPLKAQGAAAAVIGHDAGLEPHVHRLLWRSALSATPDGRAAQAELDALLRQVVPEAAGPQGSES